LEEYWISFLLKAIDIETIEASRKHERPGRPFGDSGFTEKMEKVTGRHLKLSQPGPKPNAKN